MSLARIDTPAPPVVNVRDYGATGGGVADDLAAITAAITAVASNGTVYLPKGTYRSTATLARRNGIVLRGDGFGATTISYEGAGTAIGVVTADTRSFRGGVENLTLTTATGAVGIDLDSVSDAHLRNVEVKGFSDAGIWLHSIVDGGCVYNRFYDVWVQAPLMPNSAVGIKIDGTSSNANTFFGGRTNLCNIGVRVEDSNDNTFVGVQAESGGTGFYLTATAAGLADDNRFIACRAEHNTVYGFDVASVNVRDTHIPYHWVGSNGTDFHDVGTRTFYDPQLYVNASGALASNRNIISPNLGLSSASGALQAATATGLYLRGNIANTAANVGVWIGNNPTLSTAGARIVGFCKDTPVGHTLPVSYVRQDGAYEFASGPVIVTGTGTPESAVTAPVGSLYLRTDGGAATTLYIKESGTGSTGWVGK